MHKAEGKYEEANQADAEVASLAPSDQRAVLFNQDTNLLPKLKSQTNCLMIKSLTTNEGTNTDLLDLY